MPINRGPFNALVDDDGSGTTGTPWNKARIADVILDPVDAALTGLTLDPLITSTIHRGTADGADSGNLVMSGGGGNANTRGAAIHLFGNEQVGAGGGINLALGNVSGAALTVYRSDWSTAALTINGATGATTINYGLTVSGGATVSGGELVTNGAIRLNSSVIASSSNSSYIALAGGANASSASGAIISLGGNTNPSPGAINLSLGNVAGAQFVVFRSDGNTALTIAGNTGAATFQSNIYVHGTFIASGINNSSFALCGGAGNSTSNGGIVVCFGTAAAQSGAVYVHLGANASANFHIWDANGASAMALYGSNGYVQWSTTATTMHSFNSNYVYGGYCNYSKSGTTYGYIGNGWALGVTGDSQFCIRAVGSLFLKSDVGLITAPDVYNSTTGSPNNVNVDPTGNLRRGNVSSRRYKRDIVPLDGWRFLLDLQPVSFEHIGEEGTRRVGLIAEDVADVDARFAVVDAEGRPDEVAYTHLTAPLIAAIQELHARLAALERTTDGTL